MNMWIKCNQWQYENLSIFLIFVVYLFQFAVWKIYYVFIYIECDNVWAHMHIAPKTEECQNFLKFKLQAVVSHTTCMLGTELGSS